MTGPRPALRLQYFVGKELSGIGSPHTPEGMVWPLSLAVQGLTAGSAGERAELLRTMLKLQCGNGLMHESGACVVGVCACACVCGGWGGGRESDELLVRPSLPAARLLARLVLDARCHQLHHQHHHWCCPSLLQYR